MSVVVADAARARLFAFGSPAESSALVEIEDLVNPSRRRRDSETFSDARPGLRQAQRGGPRHGVDDHREAHRAADDRAFGAAIIERAVARCGARGRCPLVVIASPTMLGILRAALAGAPGWLLCPLEWQLPNDVTRLSAPRLHDWLADRQVLPRRRRRGLEGKGSHARL